MTNDNRKLRMDNGWERDVVDQRYKKTYICTWIALEGCHTVFGSNGMLWIRCRYSDRHESATKSKALKIKIRWCHYHFRPPRDNSADRTGWLHPTIILEAGRDARRECSKRRGRTTGLGRLPRSVASVSQVCCKCVASCRWRSVYANTNVYTITSDNIIKLLRKINRRAI